MPQLPLPKAMHQEPGYTSLLRACAALQALRLLLEVLLTAVKYGRQVWGSASGWDGASSSGAGAGTVSNEIQMSWKEHFSWQSRWARLST